MLEHIYKDIKGWFSFPRLYADIIKKLPGGLIVEVGTYYGCSFSFLVIEAINSGKKFDCVAVDACPWEDVEPNFNKHMAPLKGHFRTMFGGDSFDRAKDFKDKSIDFLFLDANHTKEFVSKDIAAFLPKMKPGGIMAGHDYGNPNYRPYQGVYDAVNEAFPRKVDESYVLTDDVWVVKL